MDNTNNTQPVINNQLTPDEFDATYLYFLHESLSRFFNSQTPTATRYYLQRLGFILMKSEEFHNDPCRDEIADMLSDFHELASDLSCGIAEAQVEAMLKGEGFIVIPRPLEEIAALSR